MIGKITSDQGWSYSFFVRVPFIGSIGKHWYCSRFVAYGVLLSSNGVCCELTGKKLSGTAEIVSKPDETLSGYIYTTILKTGML